MENNNYIVQDEDNVETMTEGQEDTMTESQDEAMAESQDEAMAESQDEAMAESEIQAEEEKKVKKKKRSLRLDEFLKKSFSKIISGVAVICVLSVLITMILGSIINGLYDGPLAEKQAVNNLRIEIMDLEANIYRAISEESKSRIFSYTDSFGARYDTIMEKISYAVEVLEDEENNTKIQSTIIKMEGIKNNLNKVSECLLAFDDNGENLHVEASAIMGAYISPTFSQINIILEDVDENLQIKADEYVQNSNYAKYGIIVAMLIIITIFVIASKKIRNNIEKALLTPVIELGKVSEALAKGDLSMIATYDEEDELGDLARRFNKIIESIRRLIDEEKSLTEEMMAGKLSTRADETKFEGAYNELIVGLNQTLDGIITPLNTSSDYIERISKGDIPERIEQEAQGDYNIIKDSLNTCIVTINTLVEDFNELVKATAHGNIKLRADGTKHKGKFAAIVDGFNATLDVMTGHIDKMPSPVMIVDGNYNVLYMNEVGIKMIGKPMESIIGKKCYDCTNTNLCNTDKCVCKVATMTDEIAEDKAFVELASGRFDVNLTGVPIKSDNGKVVAAMEVLVDETEMLQAMGKVEHTAKINEEIAEYQDKEVTKLIVSLEKLAKGDFNLDTKIEPTNEITQNVGDYYNNINFNLSKSVNAIRNLVADAREIAQAAVDGKLEIRADLKKHGGEFADVMEGFNRTLDAITEPINEAKEVLGQLAQGNLSALMEGEYKGDYVEMKNGLNGMSSNLSSYVGEISEVLSGIGNGNLDQEVVQHYQGDFLEIKNSLEHILVSLSKTIGGINKAAEQVTAGSRQVSDGSQALSQGSTEQASSIQELNASIEELASKTRDNAMNAAQASNLAEEAMESAVEGNEQMQQMLISMADINESSKNISKIIKVIDDIAFQTNILALNAAVEAARAGEHGKGFAVVAEEVRNLAARSAEAAKDTTNLIEGSISKVAEGTKIANETAGALNKIVNEVEKAAELVEKIAKASNDQATGIAQIDTGLNQVGIVVQNNSATAEESAAASEELYGQAEMLKQMVANFKIKNNS